MSAKGEELYWCGDLCRYTGRTETEPATRTMPERTIYEITISEGHNYGKLRWTKNAPKSLMVEKNGGAP